MKIKMPTVLQWLIAVVIMPLLSAGQGEEDSLKRLLSLTGEDTGRVNILYQISQICQEDSIEYYASGAYLLAVKLNYEKGQANALNNVGYARFYNGQNKEALSCFFRAMHLYKKTGDVAGHAEAMNNIANVYQHLGEMNKAMTFYMAALESYKRTGNKKGVAIAWNNLGVLHKDLGFVAEATEYYEKSLKIREEIGNKQDIGICLQNLAQHNLGMGNIAKALDLYFRGLSLARESGDKMGVSISLNNLGTCYSDQGEHIKAIYFHLRSFYIAKEISDLKGMASSYGNIGSEFQRLNRQDAALYYYLKSLQIRRQLNDRSGIAESLNKTGSVYFKNNNLTGADSCFRKAGQIFRETNNPEGLVYSFSNLSAVYQKRNNAAMALASIDSAYRLAEKLGFPELIKKAAMAYSELSASSGDYRKAYENLLMGKKMSDSILNPNTQKILVEKQLRFDYLQKETKINHLHALEIQRHLSELRRQRTMRNAILGGTGLAAAFSLLLLRSHNRRKKTAFDKMVTDVEMKALRAQMDPHFIHNSLLSIDQYIRGRDEKTSSRYLQKFSRLMRMILEYSRRDQVPLADDLEALQLYMEMENLRMENPVTVNITWDDKVNPEQVLIQPMLIQPFVENAFKHAFAGIALPKLDIVISLNEPMLRFTITDNGRGRRHKQEVALEGFPVRQSLGLKVTEERLEVISRLKKIRAFFTFEDLKDQENNPTGTRVVMNVPAAFAY